MSNRNASAIFVFSLALGALLAFPSTGFAAKPTISADVKFASDVKKQRPVDPKTEFAVGTKVFAWTLVSGGQGKFRVKHVWRRNGRVVWRQSVSVRGRKHKTWSFYRVRSAGKWQVDVEQVSVQGGVPPPSPK
jgi:hypothetical protein